MATKATLTVAETLPGVRIEAGVVEGDERERAAGSGVDIPVAEVAGFKVLQEGGAN